MNAKSILVGLLAALTFTTASAHRDDVLVPLIIGGVIGYHARQPQIIIQQAPVYVQPPPQVIIEPRVISSYPEDCRRWNSYVQIRNCYMRNAEEQFRNQQVEEEIIRRQMQSDNFYRYRFGN